MATEISAQEAQQLIGGQPSTGPTEITREQALQELQFSEEFQGIPDPQIPENEKPGLVTRIIQRALGTDLEDPLELERLGTVTAGAIGGSIAGSRVPIAPGPAGLLVNPITGAAAGGLAGVIAGSVAPESAMETGEFFGVLSPGTRDRLGLSEEDLRRVVEGEALLELSTLGVATGLRAAGRFVGKSAAGIKGVDQDFAREAAKNGIDLAPFQLGDRGLGRGIVNVLGRFPFLGSKARSVGEAADSAIRMQAEGASSRIANVLGSSTIGEKLWADAKGTMKKFSKEIGKRYDDVFLEAARLGVPYRMDNTVAATKGVLARIETRRPSVLNEAGEEIAAAPSAAAKSVAEFLGKEGYGELVHQSLGQADELIKKIDQHIAKSKKGLRREVLKLLSPVRGALKGDIATNGIGPEAKAIGQKLSTIDADFSATMAQLFETPAANRLAAVQQGGLRTTVAPSQRATRMPADKLANTLVDLDSPQVMDELSRLVTPETYQQMAAFKIGEQFDKAITTVNSATRFNPEALGRSLGSTGGVSTLARREAVEVMLEKAGGALNISDIDIIVKAAQKLSNSPIPNASTFIARKATIGGAGSMLRGVLPIAALTGGGAAAGGGAGALLGGLAFVGGSRLLVGAVSNPLNARAIKEVISEETSAVVKRAAYLNLARSSVGALQEAGEITAEIAKAMLETAQETADDLFPQKSEEVTE